MAQPFIAEKGVLRTSPLEKAVAARSVAAGDSSTPSTSSNSLNPANIIDPETNAPVDAAKLSAAQEAAAAGDKKSIDWLKVIGVGVGIGTGVAAGALYKTMKDLKGNPLLNPRGDGKKPGLKDMGVKKADQPIGAVPTKTKTKIDLYVDVPAAQRQGILPGNKRLPGPSSSDTIAPMEMKKVDGKYQYNPVGPTEKQMQIEAAYAQAKAQRDKLAAERLRSGRPASGRTAAAERAFKAAEVLRRVRSLP